MSDLDFDDELLALAGDDSAALKRGKGKKKAAKRRKMEMDSESDMEMSSGSEAAAAMDVGSSDDEAGPTASNPYPLNGIYKNSADKRHIESLSELNREAVLGERQEELQKIKDRENLKNLVRAKHDEEDAGSGKRIGGRERGKTGATAEKSKKLDELKRKRQQRGRRADEEEFSPSKSRKRAASHDSWASSGRNSEEGGVDEVAEQALGRDKLKAKTEETASWEELRAISLTRKRATEICCAGFFEELCKGMWVRFPIGMDPTSREMKYRIGEVKDVIQKEKYYRVDETVTNLVLRITAAGQERTVPLNELSNTLFSQRDWDFASGLFDQRKVRPPLKKDVAKKQKMMEKYATWVKDESVIMAQVRAKKLLRQQQQGDAPLRLSVTDRLRMTTERDQAAASGNHTLAESLTAKLDSAISVGAKVNTLAAVNERNRAANKEEIRRAEIKSSEERKRLARALEAGHNVKVDPSARVKINPKSLYERTATPTGGTTPNTGSSGDNTPIGALATSASAIAVSKAKAAPATRFDEMVASSLKAELDLGDF